LLALRLFATALRIDPANVLSLWRRPWVLRGLATALVWCVGGNPRPGHDTTPTPPAPT
jgi:hypothetical protein